MRSLPPPRGAPARPAGELLGVRAAIAGSSCCGRFRVLCGCPQDALDGALSAIRPPLGFGAGGIHKRGPHHKRLRAPTKNTEEPENRKLRPDPVFRLKALIQCEVALGLSDILLFEQALWGRCLRRFALVQPVPALAPARVGVWRRSINSCACARMGIPVPSAVVGNNRQPLAAVPCSDVKRVRERFWKRELLGCGSMSYSLAPQCRDTLLLLSKRTCAAWREGFTSPPPR